MNSSADIKMISIRFHKLLWRQARLEAFKHGITMQEWLKLAVVQKLLSDGITPVLLGGQAEKPE